MPSSKPAKIADYERHESGMIHRLSDGAWIPPAPDNADYERFMDAGGVAANVPDEIMPDVLTIADLAKALTTKGVLSDAELKHRKSNLTVE